MKKIIAGFIIGSMVTASASALTAEIYLNKINITVDGKPVTAENILYNGRTYVQLRALSDIFKKPVAWDSTSNTANIGKVPTPSPTPAPIVPKLTFKVLTLTENSMLQYLVEITNNTTTELSYDGNKFSCWRAKNMLRNLSDNSIKESNLLTTGTLKPGESKSGYALFMGEADFATSRRALIYDGEEVK